MKPENTNVRPGSVAHKDSDGVWQVTEPGSIWFSTATMAATHYFQSEHGWTIIWPESAPGELCEQQ